MPSDISFTRLSRTPKWPSPATKIGPLIHPWAIFELFHTGSTCEIREPPLTESDAPCGQKLTGFGSLSAFHIGRCLHIARRALVAARIFQVAAWAKFTIKHITVSNNGKASTSSNGASPARGRLSDVLEDLLLN